MREEKVLVRARFDPKLPRYWTLEVLVVLTFSLVGLPLVPLWLLFGWRVTKKQYEHMECELTERTLNIRRGFLFKVEKNIPLDKIQDIAMKEGPLLRSLGLSALEIETAGGNVPQGAADATLKGVVDAPAFRDAILNQRDIVVGAPGATSPAPSTAPLPDQTVLVEIRDSLHRIEGLLEREANRR